jgi:hypothetical protein
MERILPRARATLLALPVLILVGCGGSGGKRETLLTRHPQWEHESYKRIVVLPFQLADRRAADAAVQATSALEDALAANGFFTLLERAALKDVLTEQDLSRLADVADPSTVIPLGRIQAAQALVIGKITEFDIDARRIQDRRPIFARDPAGRILRDRFGRPIVAREEITESFRHSARVAGSVRVIDAATGRIVFSYRMQQPIELEEKRRGAPPAASPAELAAAAARQMATEFCNNLAPIRVEVELDGDMLLVARDYLDGEYDEIKKVPADAESFLVAVRKLPPPCNRNPFRLAIAPEDARNIWEQDFIWGGENPVRGVMFQVPVSVLRGHATRDFVLKLYSAGDEQPLLTRDFSLAKAD